MSERIEWFLLGRDLFSGLEGRAVSGYTLGFPLGSLMDSHGSPKVIDGHPQENPERTQGEETQEWGTDVSAIKPSRSVPWVSPTVDL